MKTVDWIIIAIILLLVIAAFISRRRYNKNGKGCCGNCSECNHYCDKK